MRRYALVSGSFLVLLALAQVLRLALRWPVRVAGVAVLLRASAVAAAIAGGLALWGLRVARHRDRAA